MIVLIPDHCLFIYFENLPSVEEDVLDKKY